MTVGPVVLGEATRTTQSPKHRLHENAISGRSEGAIYYNVHQNASFSREREIRPVRGPMVVTAASHMTRGSLATGHTDALVDRGNDSRPFAKKARRKHKGVKDCQSGSWFEQIQKRAAFLRQFTNHEHFVRR